jgi:hypothetical protein
LPLPLPLPLLFQCSAGQQQRLSLNPLPSTTPAVGLLIDHGRLAWRKRPFLVTGFARLPRVSAGKALSRAAGR